jgi:hypothetical protein
LTKSTDTDSVEAALNPLVQAAVSRGVGQSDDRLIVGVVVRGHQGLEQRVREVLPRLVGGSGPLRLKAPARVGISRCRKALDLDRDGAIAPARENVDALLFGRSVGNAQD